ncbi:hypothetical protein TL16_g12899 [Triparma laevis f. inornata]|uniref:Uncharacterized protein n=1 Tax=Triparma laevis f. inornata TaxID=1714386 RepID=A0A9W7BXY3_9STRA|nr:hypothetical protein TL16_g12899 [Triparma laevis f. inornata]
MPSGGRLLWAESSTPAWRRYAIRPKTLKLSRTHSKSTSHVSTLHGPKVHCTTTSTLLPTNSSHGKITISLTSPTPSLSPKPTNLSHITTTLSTLSKHLLDPTSLCVIKRGYAWNLSCSLIILQCDEGSLLDSCVYALVSCLRIFLLPSIKIDQRGVPVIQNPKQKIPIPLPLQHTPVSITFSTFKGSTKKEKDKVLTDCTSLEELNSDGTCTVIVNGYGEVCLVDFFGGMGVERIVERGVELGEEVGRRLEGDLKKFEEEEEKVKESGEEEEELTEEMEENKEEEEYRKMALSYSIGHVAAKIGSKEKDVTKKRKGGKLEEDMRKYVEGDGGGSDDEEVVVLGGGEFGVEETKVVTENVEEEMKIDEEEKVVEKVVEKKQKKKKKKKVESDSDDEEVDLVKAVKKNKKSKKGKK